ncbi:unnamed protein product [Somion occarium]|uniref:Transmembrane protein 19 n=1 Tax=Somion occarium TaxID=3059160 RepID=A0ABP1D5F0_9APHY
MLFDKPWLEFLLAGYLGFSGVRKGSLSPSGGITAFIVGFSMLAVPLRSFGVSLIVFYLVGSKATKAGKELKAKLEDGHQAAGYRNATQVLCNSLSAFLAAVLWSAYFAPQSWEAKLFGGYAPKEVPYDSSEWCALSTTVAGGRSRILLFVALGHFACCLGDTLASELGILSTTPPVLITTLKTVPPGTNGGISKNGTFASLLGGFIMGVTFTASLLIESSACRAVWYNVVPLIWWGTLAGVLGSMIDSLMGATIQETKYSTKTKKILTDESHVPQSSSDLRTVSGFNLLTNNQVNLLSSMLTATILGRLAALQPGI